VNGAVACMGRREMSTKFESEDVKGGDYVKVLGISKSY
jgi:hypothetical protein